MLRKDVPSRYLRLRELEHLSAAHLALGLHLREGKRDAVNALRSLPGARRHIAHIAEERDNLIGGNAHVHEPLGALHQAGKLKGRLCRKLVELLEESPRLFAAAKHGGESDIGVVHLLVETEHALFDKIESAADALDTG